MVDVDEIARRLSAVSEHDVFDALFMIAIFALDPDDHGVDTMTIVHEELAKLGLEVALVADSENVQP